MNTTRTRLAAGTIILSLILLLTLSAIGQEEPKPPAPPEPKIVILDTVRGKLHITYEGEMDVECDEDDTPIVHRFIGATSANLGDMSAKAKQMNYNHLTAQLKLLKHSTITRGKDYMQAKTITYDLKTDRVKGSSCPHIFLIKRDEPPKIGPVPPKAE